MDWNLLGIALLLTLSGLYLLEAAVKAAPISIASPQALLPARTPWERAWQAEPIHFFMRQLFAARRMRNAHGQWHLWM